jgi:serine/threonine-protein kinase
MRMALDQAAAEAPIDQTQVLTVEGADETTALGVLVPDEPKESRLAAAVPPRWVGKRLAKLLVPLIIVALLVWGLLAAFSGSTTTKIPSFQGLTLQRAEEVAARAHLKVHTLTASSGSVTKGSVMQQNPLPSDTPVPNDTTVTLTISSGPPPCCAVPTLTGMALADAQSALTGLGLKVGMVTKAPSSQPVNQVIGQVPPAGTRLSPGNSVDLTVSQGQPQPKRKHGKD